MGRLLKISLLPPHNISNVCCCHYGDLGHTSLVCPDLKALKKPPDQVHAMVESDAASVTSYESSVIILAQAEFHTPIDPNFLLLDSQSTVDLFANPKLVNNIHPAAHPIKVHCNKGTMSTTEAGDFGDTEVYINRDGIANVLSLFKLGK
jgi:hypothetical protein